MKQETALRILKTKLNLCSLLYEALTLPAPAKPALLSGTTG